MNLTDEAIRQIEQFLVTHSEVFLLDSDEGIDADIAFPAVYEVLEACLRET